MSDKKITLFDNLGREIKSDILEVIGSKNYTDARELERIYEEGTPKHVSYALANYWGNGAIDLLKKLYNLKEDGERE